MVRILIPRYVGSKITSSLEQELGENIDLKRDDPEKVGRNLYRIFTNELQRRRKGEDGKFHSANVVFAGAYSIDQILITEENPQGLTLRLWKEVSVGLENACSIIPYNPAKSIMARACVNGQDQPVPDASKDPNHWACSDDAAHESVYVILSSKPISREPNKGSLAVVAVHDIDYGDKYTVDVETSREIGRILGQYGKAMYPGEPRIRIDHTTLIHTRPVEEIERSTFVKLPGRDAESSLGSAPGNLKRDKAKKAS